MILNPIRIATRGYVDLEPISIASMGYVDLGNVYTVIPDGGFTMDGAGDFSAIWEYTADGGVTFSGAASFSWVPVAGGGARRYWYRLGLGV